MANDPLYIQVHDAAAVVWACLLDNAERVWTTAGYVPLSGATAASAALYPVALGPTGFRLLTIPPAVPAGRLQIAYFLQVGSTPQWTDTPLPSQSAYDYLGPVVALEPGISASALFRFELERGGVPFNSSGGVTFGVPGVIRVDTAEVVVAAGTVIPNLSTGVYGYTLTPAVPGASYDWTPSCPELAGVPAQDLRRRVTVPGAVVIPTIPPSCRYCTLGDLQALFSPDSIRQWSSTNDDGDQDDRKVQYQMDLAEAEIVNQFLVYGNYSTPLQPVGSDVVLTRDWCAVLAGVGLYAVRNQGRDDPVAQAMADRVARVRAEMRRAAAGGMLNAVRRWPTATAPTAGGW